MRRSPESIRPLATPLLAALLLAAGACRPSEPPPPPSTEETASPAHPEERFAETIEEAHGADAWRRRPAFAADLTVSFGGATALEGRMLLRTDLSATRLDLGDGTAAVFDGERAWVYPEASGFQDARFHLLTWPYFLAVPMKLRDPGARLELLGTRRLQGEEYDAARLTFDEGVGDTPDDWYVVYRDPDTHRLEAMAYIVTYGKSREAAEEEPHAITYHDFTDVEGVSIPTRWQFWLWSEEEGIGGDPIGAAALAGPEFVEPELSSFDRMEGAREDALPGENRENRGQVAHSE